MKTMKKTLQVASVFALTAVLAACGGQKSDDKAIGPMRNSRATGPTNPAVSTQSFLPTATYSAVPGYVTTSNANAAKFNDLVKGFVSASMPAEQLGEVDNLNGFQFEARVKIAQGKLDTSVSQIYITIQDKYSIEKTLDQDGNLIQPVTISLKAKSFAQDSSGKISVVFEDSLGSVTIVGNVMGSEFFGTFSYKNNVVYKPGNEPYAANDGAQANPLGMISMPASGIFEVTN